MSDFLMEHYQLLRALHLIAIIAWMAGLLYLPRLFAYHASPELEPTQNELFKVMEARLLRVIMNPAMLASWLFGLLLLTANPALFTAGWMHVKLAAIVAMTLLHIVFALWRRQFAADANKRDPRFYKIWNEAPTLLMIVIIFMAVAEPF